MTTQELVTDPVKSILSNPMIKALKERENKFKDAVKSAKGLTIKGIEDKEGYEAVHKAERILVNHRTTLDKDRKALTRGLDEAKTFVMDIEKDLLKIILPEEERLKAEKQKIADAKESLRLAEEQKVTDMLNVRIKQLSDFGTIHDHFELRHMTEEQFSEILSVAKSAFEERQAQLKKEEEERQKFAEEQEKFRKEREALEAEKLAMQKQKESAEREAELKKAAEDAAEKARIETEARLKREAEEKAATEKAEAEKLESEKKFKDWLIENGVTPENKPDFEIRKDESGIRHLWKKVATYQP